MFEIALLNCLSAKDRRFRPDFPHNILKSMKIVYIAEEEELMSLIKDCIREEIEDILKEFNKQKTVPER
jgi:hypothetical protein